MPLLGRFCFLYAILNAFWYEVLNGICVFCGMSTDALGQTVIDQPNLDFGFERSKTPRSMSASGL
jgi:hypothetical protein